MIWPSSSNTPIKVRLAGAVRADEHGERAKVDCELVDRFEAFDFDSFEHETEHSPSATTRRPLGSSARRGLMPAKPVDRGRR
jgi:hypothetical protein